MQVTKMHGLGNSQIILDSINKDPDDLLGTDYEDIARGLCNESFGIGSDQMLVVSDSDEADYEMRVFNRDGGEAEMCGNGIRCVARYLRDRGYAKDMSMEIETLGGMKEVEMISGISARVGMGQGKMLEKDKEIKLDGERIRGDYISVGNPHFIVYKDVDLDELKSIGPRIEEHEKFQPEKTNVGFVKVAKNEINLDTWERGAGRTYACGTNAMASFYSARERDLVGDEARVKLPGGTLDFQYEKDGIKMTGPAEYIGIIEIDPDYFVENLERINEIER